jgi:hypothetical protein
MQPNQQQGQFPGLTSIPRFGSTSQNGQTSTYGNQQQGPSNAQNANNNNNAQNPPMTTVNSAPQPGDANFIGPVQPTPKPGDSNFVGPVQPPKPGDSNFIGPVQPATDANFFGGLTLYNSLSDNSFLSPCSQSEKGTYMVMIDNNDSSFKFAIKPIHLLVRLGTTKIGGDPLPYAGLPSAGTCVTGHFLPNPNKYHNYYCQDYTLNGHPATGNDKDAIAAPTAWRVDGIITDFKYAAGGACLPASS